MQYNKMQITLW